MEVNQVGSISRACEGGASSCRFFQSQPAHLHFLNCPAVETGHCASIRPLKRRSILALAILSGVAFALFAAWVVIWRHDPMEAIRLAAPQPSELVSSSRATGPLFRHPSNPRYFTDGSGKAIYLTGSHTWNNFQEESAAASPDLDYAGY